jgi:DNA-binding NarL/FixJ family response regulator
MLKTAVIADDNVSTRELLRIVLKTIGVERVIETVDGESALHMLREYNADLALLDW